MGIINQPRKVGMELADPETASITPETYARVHGGRWGRGKRTAAKPTLDQMDNEDDPSYQSDPYYLK